MKNRGFTIVELITVMAIIAIVAALALPGMRAFIESSQLTATANDFVEAATTARSEAIKRREAVTLKPVDGVNWKNGWALYDTAKVLIKSYDRPSSSLILSFPTDLKDITYNLNGNRQGGASFKISICVGSGKGREISIGSIGSATVKQIESGCK